MKINFRLISNKLMYKVSRVLWRLYDNQSLVGKKSIISNDYFPVLAEMEKNWLKIKEELDGIMKYRDSIPFFDEVSKENATISVGKKWRTFGLFGFGYKFEKNCKQVPYTTEILEKLPKIRTAFFSILAPGAYIPPHRGHTRGIISGHLCLTLPREYDKCGIKIEDKTYQWHEGKAFLFDDTREHQAWNKSKEERIVLLFNFDRPMKKFGFLIHNLTAKIFQKSQYMKDVLKKMNLFQNKFQSNFNT